MELQVARVEDFLYQRIPLAQALKCKVVESSNKRVVLQMPKFANTEIDDSFSDISTITICKLASWTFLQVALQQLNYKPLIHLDKATWKKARIVDTKAEAIRATCGLPSEKEWQQFLRMLSRKAKAKIRIDTTLADDLGKSATLTCEYNTRDLDYSK